MIYQTNKPARQIQVRAERPILSSHNSEGASTTSVAVRTNPSGGRWYHVPSSFISTEITLNLLEGFVPFRVLKILIT